METFDFDPSRPLVGQRLALPDVSRVESVARLATKLGAQVSRFAMTGRDRTSEQRSLEGWVGELLKGRLDDVIFLTAQGIRLLFEYVTGLDQDDALFQALANTRTIARGAQAARQLDSLGIRPTVVSPGSSTAELLACLRSLDFRGRVVGVQLYGRARETALRAYLRDAGAELYSLASGADSDAPAIELIESMEDGRIDAIVFTSSLQVEHLIRVAGGCHREDALRQGLAGTRVIAVGAAAAETLVDNEIFVHVRAGRRLVDGPNATEWVAALGLEPVARQPSRDAAPPSARRTSKGPQKTVVVVGNGMVGQRFIERLTDADAEQRYRIEVFAEERRPAYDRVQLTTFFDHGTAESLALTRPEWYAERGVSLHVGDAVTALDRSRRVAFSSSGRQVRYDLVVLATGSAPFVPPVSGMDKRGVFVYRTIDDLEEIQKFAPRCRRAAVLGGGLLGLEAAKAMLDLGLEPHIVEFAPRLMPRQLDPAAGQLLRSKVEALGVTVHLGKVTTRVRGRAIAEALVFADGSELEVDMVVVSAGIVPRDQLARLAGLPVADRGGVIVDDHLRTTDPRIYAIGECASHRKTTYGLVAPGYAMADALAARLAGHDATFEGADTATKLKLLGVDVASFGQPFEAPDAPTILLSDLVRGVYKKLHLSHDKRKLVGGVLVGDVSEYPALLQLCRTGQPLPDDPDELILTSRTRAAGPVDDSAQICSCNNVSGAAIRAAIRDEGMTAVDDIKRCTRAGTGCGGCLPAVSEVLAQELQKMGQPIGSTGVCEHFAFTRQELYEIVKVKNVRSFDELLRSHGSGAGCEVCKPVVASILASIYNEFVGKHEVLQDTNDRFLANIQRRGLYSVVPRVPGGEITPDQLITLGTIAKKYGLYTKITGGQRVDLFGARLNQLPDIWQELVEAGFESGHAYGKAMRTVKSCVGTTWCRYGVQDSVKMAIRIENRYKGIRAPHKMKSAVSGCIRECAEAQSKDFGLIATEKGWNLYVCGNGGAKPRHADLLVADVDSETAIRYLDRFIMYYIRTADRLTRTSTWLEKMPGGIGYLRQVIIDDRLEICEQLEADMAKLVSSYQCEWAAVVRDPEQRRRFQHFVNSDEDDPSVEFVVERAQRRPADWPKIGEAALVEPRRLAVVSTEWIDVGKVEDFPVDGGRAVRVHGQQLAVFNFVSRGEWHATQNRCPHRQDMVLSRGIIGDAGGVPKVACPLHKKTFSLRSGACFEDDALCVQSFAVRIAEGRVLVEIPASSARGRRAAANSPAPTVRRIAE